MKYRLYDPSDIHEMDRLASQDEYQCALDNFKSEYRHAQILKITLLGHEAKLPYDLVYKDLRKALILLNNCLPLTNNSERKLDDR